MRTVSTTAGPTPPSNMTLTMATAAGAAGTKQPDEIVPVVFGVSDAGIKIRLNVGDTLVGQTVTDDQGKWSAAVAIDAVDGQYDITATAIDQAGNTSTSDAVRLTLSGTPIGLLLRTALDKSDSLGRSMNVPRDLQVVVGGINDYQALSSRTNFINGMSTGRLGLYQHWFGVVFENERDLNRDIATTWKYTTPGEIETNLWDPNFFHVGSNASVLDGLGISYYSNWLSSGLSATMQNVNFGDPFLMSPAEMAKTVTDFKNLTDASRAVGIATTAPVYSPNGGLAPSAIQSGATWMSERFLPIRQMALYGGALTIDAPPSYFFNQSPAYQGFCEAQIRWAEANHLRTTVILSPDDSGSNFLDDAKRFVRALASANAIPTQWAVENYVAIGDYAPGDGVYPNPIGSELKANTVAQVATYLAKTVSVVTYGSDGLTYIESAGGFIIATETIGDNGNTVTLHDSKATSRFFYSNDGVIVGSTLTPADLSLALASDSGLLGDGLTNVSLPVLIGAAPPGSTIQIYDGATLIGTGTATGIGAFSVSTSIPLSDGIHTLTAKAMDSAGNVSPTSSASLSLIISSSLPVVNDSLFDAEYYLLNNLDVAAAGADPYQHYMTTGWKEGRDPSALFNTRFYLNQNPDVAAARVNPLEHFETIGWKEGRDPSVGFSVPGYLALYWDVKAAGINPLLHFVQNGKAEGRMAFAAVPHDTVPHDPLVNDGYVYAHNPGVAAAGLDASAWFNSVGWAQGANPNGYFDTSYYLTRNPDVQAAGFSPLAHFEAFGWKEGRQPSLAFDDAKYLSANPDVAAAGVNPLVHYLANGLAEGRIAFLAGGSAAADPLVSLEYYEAQCGASIMPGGTAGAEQAAYAYDHGGWEAGLNPDAFFDTSFYLSHNPDVAAARVNPLLHYETYGWKEGRDPSASFSTNKYLAAYGDVRAAGIDPLLHYVVNGQGEGRTTFST